MTLVSHTMDLLINPMTKKKKKYLKNNNINQIKNYFNINITQSIHCNILACPLSANALVIHDI